MSNALNILLQSIQAGITKSELTTSQAHEMLRSCGVSKDKIRSDRFAEKLGRTKYGAGRNLKFSTLKVIEFKIKLEKVG